MDPLLPSHCLENSQDESVLSSLQPNEAAHIPLDLSGSTDSSFGSKTSSKSNAFVKFFDKLADANTGGLVYKCKMENCEYLSRLKITEDALRKHIMKFHKDVYDGVKQVRIIRKSDTPTSIEPKKIDKIVETNVKAGGFVDVDFNGRVIRLASDKISNQRLEKLFYVSMTEHQLVDCTNKAVTNLDGTTSFYCLTNYSHPFKILLKSDLAEKCIVSEPPQQDPSKLNASSFEERACFQSIENKDVMKILKVEELLSEESFASSFLTNQSCSSVDQSLDQLPDSITPAITQKAKRARKHKVPVIEEQSSTTIDDQSQSPVVKEKLIMIKGAPKKTLGPLHNVKMEDIKLEKQWLAHLLERFGNCQLCAQPIQNDFLTCVQCGQLTGCTTCMVSLCQQQLTKCPRCTCIWDFRSFQVNYTLGNFLFPSLCPMLLVVN